MLQNNYHNKFSYNHPLMYKYKIKTKYVFVLVMKPLEVYFLNNYQISCREVLTIVFMLYINYIPSSANRLCDHLHLVPFPNLAPYLW